MGWAQIALQIAAFVVSAFTTIWPMFHGQPPDAGHAALTAAVGGLAIHNYRNGSK